MVHLSLCWAIWRHHKNLPSFTLFIFSEQGHGKACLRPKITTYGFCLNEALHPLRIPSAYFFPQSLRLSNHAGLPVFFYFLGEQPLARRLCSFSQAPGKGVFVLSSPDNSDFWGFLWSSHRGQVDTDGVGLHDFYWMMTKWPGEIMEE